jgi:DAK2 domain fusion protein YloV
MDGHRTIAGQELKGMFSAALDWFEKSVSEIDALNVFPVPDGDCGTNMLLTTRSSLDEASKVDERSISSVAQAMAKGALMGARGNSGVILSQIWRGLANSLSEKATIDGKDLAKALLQASEMAYRGLSNPVEGTILTVIREAALAAEKRATDGNGNVTSVLEAAVEAAKESVANTPSLLPVLREAGVVDAGGQGLYTLLEGALLYLKGEINRIQSDKPEIIASRIPVTTKQWQDSRQEEVPFGYCTEFILEGENLNPDEIRQELGKQGQSVIAVGDPNMVRVHIHVLDPSNVIRYAVSLGNMHKINIRNMDEQYEDFLALQRERGLPMVDVAVVAVVTGEGLSRIFTSLGASAIVPGGQTMNPSTGDILKAVEVVPSEKVIILPNNKNIVLTAQQVESLSKKNIKVIPTETISQGVTALMAFDPGADFETNVKRMNREKFTVKTIEVTHAVRSTRLSGLNIEKEQAIGFVDGELLAVADKTGDVITDLFTRLDLDSDSVVTIYYGANTEPAEAEDVAESIRQQYPMLEVDVVDGGQPHYNYIVSVE